MGTTSIVISRRKLYMAEYQHERSNQPTKVVQSVGIERTTFHKILGVLGTESVGKLSIESDRFTRSSLLG